MLCLILFLLFSLPSLAMESVPEPMREQNISLRLGMTTDIEKNVTALFDGSRRFYDEETRNQAKRKSYKQCIKLTALRTTLSGGACSALMLAINFLALLITHDSVKFSYPEIVSLTFAESSFFIAIYLVYFSILDWITIVQPVTKEYNPFREHISDRWPCNQVSLAKPYATIPESMINAASTTKLIHADKNKISTIYRSSTIFEYLHFDRLRRVIFSKNDFELLKRIQNILLLAELSENDKDKEFCSMHEKDFLSLMKKNEPYNWEDLTTERSKPYLAASILAENGWVAFSQSEKYPIQCNMQYFDMNAIPEDTHVYFTEHDISPTMYLPFSTQLAHYYKFEEDPAYTLEYEAPTNRQLAQLLQLRQEIIGRNPELDLPVQNNNNQG